MGTDPLDSGGRGPGLEEMEPAGPEASSRWGPEVEAEGKKPGSRATTETETVVPRVSYPPGQCGSGWEERTPTMADCIEEEGEEEEEVVGLNRRVEEQEPLLGLTPPGLEDPLPSAKEEESVEGAGQGLPFSGSTGADPLFGILEDAVLHRGRHREAEEAGNKEKEVTEEGTKEVEVALESCCIQVECPICMEPYDQEAEETVAAEEIEVEEKEQMLMEGATVALGSRCIQVKDPLREVECPICMEPCDQEAEEIEAEEKEQMLVEGAAVALESCCIPGEEPPEGPECPICTEPYDQQAHRPAPLNCGHVLCRRCLQAILEAGSAADIGRVRCPICRQKTPMMEWEICRLQEELLLLGAWESPSAASALFRPPPPRSPGFWGGLEHRFRVRLLASRSVGCLPCLRYPAGLARGLERLEGRCRWGYRLALLALAAADALSLLLVFLPVALLLLLFLIMDQ